MADTNNGLPEGTDTIIEGGGAGGASGGTGRSGTTGGSGSPSTGTNSTGGRTSMTAGDRGTDSLITGQTTDPGRSTGGGSGSAGGSNGGSDNGDVGTKSGIRGMISSAGTKARDEATSRARGFVGQGLTSGSATLGNVASIIEDTVEQIGEKLGPQYGDYARSASETVKRYATTLENKDPDELVDDVRDIVRKSPGVALAGAAIIGFGLARLLRAGIAEGTATSSSDSGASTRGSASIGSSTPSSGSTPSGGSTSTGGSTGASTGTGGSLAGRTQPKV